MKFGLLGISIWQAITITIITTHVTIASVTIFLHRHQAHRSLDLHPALSHFFRFWLWLTTGINTKEWVSVHRKHHIKCETDEDPHSPLIYGLKTLIFRGAALYRQETAKKETLIQYGQGTPDDWMERNVYSRLSSTIGILSLLTFEITAFGTVGLAMWLIQMAWIPFWAAGIINGVGHVLGYRTFSSKDTSTNMLPWGIVIGGEELHNNHHAFPRSAKLSFKPWEFDIGWLYIKMFSYLGLAKVNSISPDCEESSKPFILNGSNILASLSVKMRILKQYEKIVLSKALKQEIVKVITSSSQPTPKVKVRERFDQLMSIFTRDKSLLSSSENEMLHNFIKQSDAMRILYEMRDRFSEIWQGIGISVQERVAKIKAWCKEAEAYQNKHLNLFIRYLQRKMPTLAETY